MMTFESLIGTYGYLAILAGTFLEGETILVVGALAAHRGYLQLPWVVSAAFVGTFLGDQFFFFLGRRHSEKLLAKWPSWRYRTEKARKLIARYRSPIILVFRFLYGIRTVTPFAIGMSNVPASLFLILNAVAALLWATIVGTGGYLFGDALHILIGNVKHYEIRVIGAVAALGAFVWVVYFIMRRRKYRMASTTTTQK